MTRTIVAALVLVAATAAWSPGRQDTLVRVMTSPPVEVTIDALEVSPEGQWRVTSTRTAAPAPSISFAVDGDRARFVRFSRAGASPITVPVTDLLREPPWTLPDAQPGGEIVAAIEPAAILPRVYRLRASPTETRMIERSGRGFISAVGLPEGAYELIPEYEGGVLGQKISFAVTTGASTAAFLKREEVGAAHVRAAEAACLPDLVFSLRRVWLMAMFDVEARSPRTTGDMPACQWTVAGLAPGSYEAWLEGPQYASRSSVFEIASQTVTSVTIPAPPVLVSGRVTYNGEPFSRADLAWILPGGAPAKTRTDVNGRYRLALAAAGEYVVGVSARSMLLPMHPALVHEGENTVDLDLKGGALTIRVHRWNHASPVTIDVRSPNPLSSQMHTLQPGDDPVVDRAALNFGTYVVSASQESVDLITREKKTVTLDDQHPDQTIDLELVPGRLRLVLRDGAGRPVTGATVRDGTLLGFFGLDEVEPGVFRLDYVDPKALLRIKASGFVPACHTMPAGTDTLELTLAAGRTVEVQLPAGEEYMSSRVGALVDLDGSDCPVPLTDLSSRKLPTSAGQPVRYTVDGFPNARSVVLEVDGQRYEVPVPDRGPVVLRR